MVDTWWQTETGAIMITPLPGVTTLKPGSATKPFPGIGVDIVDEAGEQRAARWRRLHRADPAVALDAARHLRRRRALREDVLVEFPHMYLAGDGCNRDDDGDYWFMGRIDDVMNISGHRISTAEVE